MMPMVDADFLSKFKEGTLPPSEFTHVAHLRLAWLHVDQYGVDIAIEMVTNQIKNYVRLHGAEDKFHVTLTIAAVRTVHHFYNKTSGSSFNDMVREYPNIVSDFKGLIKAHYSFDILGSSEAKTDYLEPDLLPYE